MTARVLVLVLALIASGCGRVGAPGKRPVQLPPPDEARRVRHPAGYSIVFPEGLSAGVNPSVYLGDSSTKDALASVNQRKSDGTEQFGGPQLSVRRFSDQHVATNSGKPVPAFFRETQFQNRPAFARFDSGYGPGSERAGENTTAATRGSYSPNLDQELIFERDGSWFHLSFSMRNLRGNESVHAAPLEVVEQYFGTFQYQPSGR
jgi:hypothetical protein